MIIGNFFDGDEHESLKIVQQEVYHQSIGLMIQLCNRSSKHVVPPPDLPYRESWGFIDSCDHRTIQLAHDLLAAAYRFKHVFRPDELKSIYGKYHDQRWRNWLFSELLSWKKSPRLIEEFLIIMNNQNEPNGCQAEARLCFEILERFPEIPWDPNLRETLC
jgi:hypothetical protein